MTGIDGKLKVWATKAHFIHRSQFWLDHPLKCKSIVFLKFCRIFPPFPGAAIPSILVLSSRDGYLWKAESVGYKSLFHQPISIPTASPLKIQINHFSPISWNFSSFSGSCQIVNFGPIKSWRVSLETSKCRLQKLISSTHLNSDWITPQNWNFQFFP